MAGNTLGTFLPGALAGTFENLLLDRGLIDQSSLVDVVMKEIKFDQTGLLEGILDNRGGHTDR